jgi:hypothetical protein
LTGSAPMAFFGSNGRRDIAQRILAPDPQRNDHAVEPREVSSNLESLAND